MHDGSTLKISHRRKRYIRRVLTKGSRAGSMGKEGFLMRNRWGCLSLGTPVSFAQTNHTIPPVLMEVAGRNSVHGRHGRYEEPFCGLLCNRSYFSVRHSLYASRGGTLLLVDGNLSVCACEANRPGNTLCSSRVSTTSLSCSFF